MRIERLHGWVLPVVLAVVAADVQFFLYAAIGDPSDYVGIVFFALFGLYGVQSLLARREWVVAFSTLGAAAGLALMLLRQADIFDKGYIPPYLVFIGFVLVGYLLGRRGHPSS